MVWLPRAARCISVQHRSQCWSRLQVCQIIQSWAAVSPALLAVVFSLLLLPAAVCDLRSGPIHSVPALAAVVKSLVLVGEVNVNVNVSDTNYCRDRDRDPVEVSEIVVEEVNEKVMPCVFERAERTRNSSMLLLLLLLFKLLYSLL